MGSKWDTIEIAIRDSSSIAESLRKMDLDPRGSNYRKFYRIVKDKNLDTSHFLGKAHGTTIQEIIPWSEVLTKESCYELTTKRKRRLISDGILKNVCNECGISEWNTKPITLQIDHINGDHYDNRIENIRLICPNCHSQTSTYCGRNIKNDVSRKRKYKDSICRCGRDKSRSSQLCINCEKSRKAIFLSKIKWPSILELNQMLSLKSYRQVGRELGVSDNAIRKHLRTHQDS